MSADVVLVAALLLAGARELVKLSRWHRERWLDRNEELTLCREIVQEQMRGGELARGLERFRTMAAMVTGEPDVAAWAARAQRSHPIASDRNDRSAPESRSTPACINILDRGSQANIIAIMPRSPGPLERKLAAQESAWRLASAQAAAARAALELGAYPVLHFYSARNRGGDDA